MNYPLDALTQIPSSVVSTYDYERLARHHMGESAWVYFSSAGADEQTHKSNRKHLDTLRLYPRVLRNLSDFSTEVVVAGKTYPHPIFLAPVAFQKLAHKDGELATVLGASALQAPMVVSTQASVRLEDIARQAETSLWFQLYVQPDRAHTLNLIQRAEASGYEALVITVDAPINGVRNAMQRINFQVPAQFLNINTPSPVKPPSFQDLLHAAPTWKDLEWLLSQTRLPVWLKGILHPEDAQIAKELGCTGVVVSNHGGRTLDTIPSTIEVLPSIRKKVGPAYPLIMDGGIRRGTDILKALALGANAVMIGRPYVNALSVAGALGVAHSLQLLKSELEIAMSLCGTPNLKSVTPEILFAHSTLG